jgi:hypothetical protein
MRVTFPLLSGGHMAEGREDFSLRGHAITAAILFVAELILGVGVLGGAGVLIAIVIVLALFKGTPPLSHRLKAAALYAGVAAATMALLLFNVKIAERRAGPVIQACERFHAERHRYPSQLDELVPEYLPSVPDAKYTLLARKFGYDSDRPSLYFAAMFHGIFSYDFQTDTWKTND